LDTQYCHMWDSHMGGGLILILKPVLFTVSLHLYILCLYHNQH